VVFLSFSIVYLFRPQSGGEEIAHARYNFSVIMAICSMSYSELSI